MSFINLVSEELDTSLEDTDELLNRRNEKSLIRAVREVNLRTNGSAFHVRILVEEETALETSVDGIDERLLLGLLSVGLLKDLGDEIVSIGLPSGILTNLLRESGTDNVAEALELAVHHLNLSTRGRTDGTNEIEGSLARLGDSKNHRGFNESLDLRRHSHRTERNDVEEVDELLGAFLSSRSIRSLSVSDVEGGIGLNLSVLMSKALELGSDLLDESSFVSLRNSNESLALTRNGVVGSTTLHGDNSVVDLGRLEESSHDVDGVATTEVDLDTRVTTAGVVDDELLDGVTLDGLTLSLEVDLVGETTSATDADLAALLRIDVDQVLGLEDAGLEGGSTVKTGLLISGDEDLERTVLELLVGKEGEAGTDTDTIIGTEGSTLGADVLAIAVGLERIGLHVDGAVIGLLADHIHMALVADDGLVLET